MRLNCSRAKKDIRISPDYQYHLSARMCISLSHSYLHIPQPRDEQTNFPLEGRDLEPEDESAEDGNKANAGRDQDGSVARSSSHLPHRHSKLS